MLKTWIAIGYVLILMLIAGIFVFRARKRTFTFKPFLVEETGLLLTSILLSLNIEIKLPLKLAVVGLVLLTFFYGCITREDKP
ncbi:hypothetical protein KIH86_20995 [Paenibacillus sp. HN-1]|uniref:hypothetical protein n=1 Tax=Paenibacillus TaxID=44249 RepID=UPI001CA968BE|nr:MULTISPECIES: hypothetical protein [Paenibacillus]MBY9079987.1 hypothetical protein [Paenibacillus sp. CGMCC 1.18879]MBY9086685.1 hypothetical protein [Paenibacillus sinensis]